MKSNIRLSTLLILLFIYFSSTSFAQSKFEFGLGVAINHSNMNIKTYSSAGPYDDVYKLLRLPAITSRVGFKYSDRFHLNSGFGFSWLGALNRDLEGRIIASSLEIPLQLEWNILQSIQLSTGFNYNYIYSLSEETKTSKDDIIDEIYTRHQFGLNHKLAYSHKLVEMYVSYAHYMTNVFYQTAVDDKGTEIGTLVSKLSNIQIGFVIRS